MNGNAFFGARMTDALAANSPRDPQSPIRGHDDLLTPGFWLLAALLYLGLFCVLTYPLMTQPAHLIVANHGDAFHDMQLFWYMRRGDLFKPHIDTLFYPWGVALGAEKGFLLVPAISVPLQWFMPLPLAYNFLCAVFFVATGLAATALAAETGARASGSLLGGLLLLLSPSYLSEMTGGIPENMCLQWLLLYLVCGLQLRRRFRPTMAVAAALCLTLTWMTSWYLGAFAMIFSLLLPLKRMAPIVFIVGLIVLLPIVSALEQQGGTQAEGYDALVARDLLSGTLVVPRDMNAQRRLSKNVAPTMRILRESVDPSRLFVRYRPTKMRDVLPGLLLIGLSVLGMLRSPRRVGPWMAVAALFGLLSLGPHLIVASRDVIALPSEWLYEHVSLFGRIRPIRWMLAATISLCVAAAHSLPCTHVKRGGMALAMGLAALQAFEVFVVHVAHYRVYLAPTDIPACYQRLAAEPHNEALIDMPLAPYSLQVGQQLYYQTMHQHPMMNYDFVSSQSERMLEQRVEQNSLLRLIAGADDPAVIKGGGEPIKKADVEDLAHKGLRTLLLHTRSTPPVGAPFESYTFPSAIYNRLCQIYGKPSDEGDGILRFDMSKIASSGWNDQGLLAADGSSTMLLTDYFRPRLPQDGVNALDKMPLASTGSNPPRFSELRLWVLGDVKRIMVVQGQSLLGTASHRGQSWDWLQVPLQYPAGPGETAPIQVLLDLGTVQKEDELDQIRLSDVELYSYPPRGR